MPYVYMLRCADGTLYVGSTRDLERRLAEHQSGAGAAYTRRRLPVELFWCDEVPRIDEAFAWEKRLQGWSHAKLVAYAEGGLDAVIGWEGPPPARVASAVLRFVSLRSLNDRGGARHSGR